MPSGMESLYQLQTLPLFVSGKLPKGSKRYVRSTWNFGNLGLLGGLNLHGELNITRLENTEDATPADKGQLFMKENLESLGLYWGLIPGFKDSFAKPPNAPAEVGVSGSHIPLHAKKLIRCLQPHENLKNLVINGYPGIKFPNWALPNLIAADFTNCRSCEHLPTLGNLPLLKTLSLHGMHGVKSIGTEFYGDSTDIWFPSLEELSVSDIANLEEWSTATDERAFPILKKLTVKSVERICPTLKS
ncbi:putative disease resistance protein RGA1 [Prunus avium]|uniref:Disease resistance protein RGA1 n=1 Tax=Prunus avium TaxID=42229 RepID=A0A6P5RZ09_PRUAV|nr:putative disease resistance protein RGA1 [Prunus avium]